MKNNGMKLKSDFKCSNCEISKYNRIIYIKYQPGRPGEEYYEVLDDKGNKYKLSRDQHRSLEKILIK